MGKKRSRIGKYDKISNQMKYSLVRSVRSNGMNLLTTSKEMRIKYSTAKSILFQYRNRTIKNSALLDNLEVKDEPEKHDTLVIALQKPLKSEKNQTKGIKIISTVNGESIPETQIDPNLQPRAQLEAQANHCNENNTKYQKASINKNKSRDQGT